MGSIYFSEPGEYNIQGDKGYIVELTKVDKSYIPEMSVIKKNIEILKAVNSKNSIQIAEARMLDYAGKVLLITHNT